jgi:predicted dehydrogenase
MLRVGLVSTAHVHAPSYARCLAASPRAEVTGVWDDDAPRGEAFAMRHGLSFVSDLDSLLAE